MASFLGVGKLLALCGWKIRTYRGEKAHYLRPILSPERFRSLSRCVSHMLLTPVRTNSSRASRRELFEEGDISGQGWASVLIEGLSTLQEGLWQELVGPHGSHCLSLIGATRRTEIAENAECLLLFPLVSQEADFDVPLQPGWASPYRYEDPARFESDVLEVIADHGRHAYPRCSNRRALEAVIGDKELEGGCRL